VGNLLSLVSKLLGNLLPLCREITGARDILQKFENLKKTRQVKFQLMILHFYDGDQGN
jgi:hypothetical protein